MEKKETNKETINSRFLDIVELRRNQIFKMVLTAVEEESRKFKVDPHFFDKQSNPKAGYGCIRKILLDEMNDFVRFIGLILGEITIVPTRSIIKIDEKVLNDDKDNKKNAPNRKIIPDAEDN